MGTTTDLPDDLNGEHAATKHGPPPVIVPPRGVPIPPVSRAELTRMEEEQDEARSSVSTRLKGSHFRRFGGVQSGKVCQAGKTPPPTLTGAVSG